MDTLTVSDKHYWHRLIPTYEAALNKLGRVRRVMEIGVLHDASIRWLTKTFPDAEIIGADIQAA